MKLAVYATNVGNSLETINKIKQFLLATENYSDFFICVDVLNTATTSWATLHPFYLPFFDGHVVFLSLEDYISNRDKIIGESILYVSSEGIRSEVPVDRSMFKNCRFITVNNNELVMVKNYEV